MITLMITIYIIFTQHSTLFLHSNFLNESYCMFVFCIKQMYLQQIFIMLQTLSGRSSNDGGNCSPLSGHQFGQVKKFLLFLTWPFCFLNARIQPLIPAWNTSVKCKCIHYSFSLRRLFKCTHDVKKCCPVSRYADH